MQKREVELIFQLSSPQSFEWCIHWRMLLAKTPKIFFISVFKNIYFPGKKNHIHTFYPDICLLSFVKKTSLHYQTFKTAPCQGMSEYQISWIRLRRFSSLFSREMHSQNTKKPFFLCKHRKVNIPKEKKKKKILQWKMQTKKVSSFFVKKILRNFLFLKDRYYTYVASTFLKAWHR